MTPAAFGAIGIATGVACGVLAQRVAAHSLNPQWERYDLARANLPEQLHDQLQQPKGTVVASAIAAGVTLAGVGMAGSVAEVLVRRDAGRTPFSAAFVAGGIIGGVYGAHLARGIAGDEH